MANAHPGGSTRTSRVIQAPREVLYRAFTDSTALAVWLWPAEMTGKVHEFDGRVGGGYRMSLFYPASEQANRGKTSEREDRCTARFVVTFEERDEGTEVIILFEHIPPGYDPRIMRLALVRHWKSWLAISSRPRAEIKSDPQIARLDGNERFR